MTLDKAKLMSQDRNRRILNVVSNYPNRKRRDYMYLCVHAKKPIYLYVFDDLRGLVYSARALIAGPSSIHGRHRWKTGEFVRVRVYKKVAWHVRYMWNPREELLVCKLLFIYLAKVPPQRSTGNFGTAGVTQITTSTYTYFHRFWHKHWQHERVKHLLLELSPSRNLL